MTSTLPRPIEPGEIKAGMRVRLAWEFESKSCTIEATAIADWDSSRGGVLVGDGQYLWNEPNGRWELLAEAPAPAPTLAPTSWRLRLADELREAAAEYTSVPSHYRDGFVDGLRLVADRLENRRLCADIPDIPDHSDGCSPWPRGANGEPRCDEQMDNLTCSRVRDHDGFHAAYGSVGDAQPYLVWAEGERVASWSERGQANG